MLRMSWSTFRERWHVFLGAMITVCLGVALVQSSLLTLISAATARVPAGLPEADERALRDGYVGAISLLGMTLGLASFVAVFVVSSTFAFTVAQRRRDLALLRLTGASRRQVRTLLVGEALLLGTAGSSLGVLAGVPLMRVQTWMLDHLDLVPPGFVAQWRSWVVAASMGTGLSVAVLGVLAASRRASRVQPLEALRETGKAARVMTASRWVFGLIFLAGSVTMMVLIPAVGGDGALAMSIFVSMLLVVCFAALAPLVVPLMSWVLRALPHGDLGQLAYANLRDGVRRTASTAAPIMVLVAFVAGLAGTLDTTGEAARRELTRTLNADLIITTPHDVRNELAAVGGVGAVSEEVPTGFERRVDEGDGQSSYEYVDAISIDPAAYGQTHRLEAGSGDLADLKGATVAVSPSYDPDAHWRVGDTLPVRLGGKPADLRIVALLPPTIAGPYFLLPPDVGRGSDTIRAYTVKLTAGADRAAATQRLSNLGQVVTTSEWIRQHGDEEQRMSINIMLALLGMAMLYTVIAMVNAVVISASDRRAEFAAARVSGLTRGQVVIVTLWESLAVVAIGLLLGGLAAAGTVLGVSSAINDMIGITVVDVGWPLLGALALGTAAIVAVTSVVTTLSATRTPAVRLVAARE
jgi:putative ABC transport system permease protein